MKKQNPPASGSKWMCMDMDLKLHQILASVNKYAELGLRIFPVHSINSQGQCTCPNPDCEHPGKHPRIKDNLRSATTDPKQIKEWWNKWPSANIGLATGPGSGVFVLDVDGPEGQAALDALEHQHGPIPPTWKSKTGRGYHFFLRSPEGDSIKTSSGVIGKGLDVRADNAYVILPPSKHHSGTRYEWVASFEETPLAAAPAWLLDLIKRPKESTELSKQRTDGLDLGLVLEGVPEGQRDDRIFRYACRLIAKGMTEPEIETLVLEAARNCTPPFPEKEALAKIESAFKIHGRQDPEKESTHLKVVPDSQEIIRQIEFLPPDTPSLDLASRLDVFLRSLAKLPEPEAEAILGEFIKRRFNLNTHQVDAYRRQVRQYRTVGNTIAGNEAKKQDEAIYCALFPGLIDIVLDDEARPAFLVVEDGQLKVSFQEEREGIIYTPPPLEPIPQPVPRAEVVLGIWELESRVSVEQADAALFDDLYNYFLSISELPNPLYYMLLVLWAVHTHLIESFRYSPILCLYAVPERGKTRTGKALLYVCRRGLHTETLREAYLIRDADRNQGTIFFDVMNLWEKAGKAGCEDLLLHRYERGPLVPRVLYPDRPAFKDTVYFNIFGPTIIATNEAIHRILDSRCITITMPQTTKQFQTDVTPERALELKERLLSFRARHAEQPLPEAPKIASGRLGDILRPLHQILLLMKPQAEPDFFKLVELIKGQRTEEKRETLEARVISLILQMAEQGDEEGNVFLRNNKIPIKAITARLNNGLPEKDWTIKYQKVGRLIKALGLEKGTLHGGGSAVVWDEEKIVRIAEAYGVDKTSP